MLVGMFNDKSATNENMGGMSNLKILVGPHSLKQGYGFYLLNNKEMISGLVLKSWMIESWVCFYFGTKGFHSYQ